MKIKNYKEKLVFVCAFLSLQVLAQTVPPSERQLQEATQFKKQIKTDLDRVFTFLNTNTPAAIIDSKTGNKITDYRKIDANSKFEEGRFGLVTYEWGVTYSGMLRVAEITNDKKYADYVFERMRLIGETYPYFKIINDKTGNSGLRALITPKWLDDCGSMGAAMIKTSLANPELSPLLCPVIDNAFNFVMYKEYRLYNRLLARKRPMMNSVWLDDMYMGIPILTYMGKLIEKDNPTFADTLYNESALQIELFQQKLWIPEMKLFRHGWIESMKEHPSFFWGRANGWALLAMCDVLDILPENYPQYEEIMALFLEHLKGIAALQSGKGSWHQLLDRNDSYLETSATAMYTYCMAHAINKGWVDPLVYEPLARSAWKAVSTMINAQGEVENTCVGTGLAFYPAFYYDRPVSVNAAHGYGPVLLAGAEMIALLENRYSNK